MRPSLALMLLAACAPAADTHPLDGTDTTKQGVCGPSAARGLAVGQCAPEFTLPDQANQAFTLSAQRGKVALVDISAVW